jgi:DNA-binding beta-propeller fold protein YncE
MNIRKFFHLLFLACFLIACAAPAKPTPASPQPTVITSTALPDATATTQATLATPTVDKATPKTIDPGSSVIQISYPSNSGLSNSILALVDPTTGMSLPPNQSFSSNMDAVTAIPGRLAAVQGFDQVCEPMAYGTSCYQQADVLHLIDLRTMQDITATLPARGWVDHAAFSPDGTRLALVDNHPQEGSTLLFFDSETGSVLASQPLSIRPSLIAFRTGKNQLVVYGQSPGSNPGVQQPPNPHILLLDLPDLKIAWDHELNGVLSGHWCDSNCKGFFDQSSFAMWNPFVVTTPDGNALYIAHADIDSLTRVDLQTHAVTTTNLQTASAWLEQLLSISPQIAYAKGNENGTILQGVLSPDGKRLYLLGQTFHSTLGANGNWNTNISYSGLKVIDLKTGRILKQLDTHASELQISPDGKSLYLMNWDSPQAETEIVSTDQFQIMKKLLGWQITLTRRLDGAPIAIAIQIDNSIQQRVGILDPQGFSIGQTWEASAYVQFVTFN